MGYVDPRMTPGTDTNDKIICLAEIAMSTPAGVAITAGVPVKIGGTTAGVFETFGIAKTTQGRITYEGPKGEFLVMAQVALRAVSVNNANPIIYLAKNGSIIAATRMQKTTNRSNESGSQSLNWELELDKGDFIELWMDVAISETMSGETMVLTLLG